LSSGGVPTDVSDGSRESSPTGCCILLLGDSNLRPLPTMAFHDMLNVSRKDVWCYDVNRISDLVSLQKNKADALCSVQTVLVSFLSWFAVNPRDPGLPHNEAICKYF